MINWYDYFFYKITRLFSQGHRNTISIIFISVFILSVAELNPLMLFYIYLEKFYPLKMSIVQMNFLLFAMLYCINFSYFYKGDRYKKNVVVYKDFEGTKISEVMNLVTIITVLLSFSSIVIWKIINQS